MHISRLAVGAVNTGLLSDNAIAGALEDCAAAYDRKDYAAALQPCLSLAEHGDARAQLRLGGICYNGQGVQQDYAEAAKWTRKAAEQGYTPAQTHLGVPYWNGQGVQQDVVLGYMWLSLAAAHGPGAVKERDLAASQMTHDEIAEAQRLARDWKPTTHPHDPHRHHPRRLRGGRRHAAARLGKLRARPHRQGQEAVGLRSTARATFLLL
jgi:TPR repeat protein